MGWKKGGTGRPPTRHQRRQLEREARGAKRQDALDALLGKLLDGMAPPAAQGGAGGDGKPVDGPEANDAPEGRTERLEG